MRILTPGAYALAGALLGASAACAPFGDSDDTDDAVVQSVDLDPDGIPDFELTERVEVTVALGVESEVKLG